MERDPLIQSPRTALDQGLEHGFRWAQAHLTDRARLGRVARAHTAAEVVANLDPDDQLPDSVADPVAYWSGFAHGVQRVVRETAGGSPRPPRPLR